MGRRGTTGVPVVSPPLRSRHGLPPPSLAQPYPPCWVAVRHGQPSGRGPVRGQRQEAADGGRARHTGAAGQHGGGVRRRGAALRQLALHPEEPKLGRAAVEAVTLPAHQVCSKKGAMLRAQAELCRRERGSGGPFACPHPTCTHTHQARNRFGQERDKRSPGCKSCPAGRAAPARPPAAGLWPHQSVARSGGTSTSHSGCISCCA